MNPPEARPALLERSSQLAVLDSEWAAVEAGIGGRLVVVGGEAGAGKTTLVRRFCDTARGEPRVLVGACDALFTARPLGPFVDVARATRGATLALLVADPRPDEVAGALLDDLAATSPTIVVLEDLHWADDATLDVLRLLARRIEGQSTLLIGTYRDELDRGHPLKLLLGELPSSLVRLRVPAFSAGAVAELAVRAGVDAAELYHKTGGNPFFVTEVVAAPSETIPDTVRDAVLARVARLGSGSLEVLEAVAIVPSRAETWLVESLVPGSADGIERALRTGMLVSSGDALSFRHELARQAVEESLAPGRRSALHRAVVQALSSPEHGQIDLARLAHHADAGADADAVLRFAPEAAARAATLGAHREAAAQYGRALRYAGVLDPARKANLLARHAEESFFANRVPDAITSGAEAVRLFAELGDHLQQAEALLDLARMQWIEGRRGDAEGSAAQALALLED
ncbi:MAG TPA: AAA family ATPase, partial [Candidatus Binatus sp.]|nr:AAA family ATPase [Candidatus Binatus sp.]